jgi:transposase
LGCGLVVAVSQILLVIVEIDGRQFEKSYGQIARTTSITVAYLHEVEHAEACIARLDLAYEEAVKSTQPKMYAVIHALQALHGIAQVASVTIVAEMGEVSRFTRARQCMGYGGIVASDHSTGECTR